VNLRAVGLREDLDRIAAAAAAHADPGEEVSAVIPTEPAVGLRVYICAYERDDATGWLAFDDAGEPVRDRVVVRDAVSIAGLCEAAEELAGGGDVEGLRAELRTLRLTESPEGIEEAEEAALALERTLAPAPRLASPAYLDAVGLATRRLEEALGDVALSPFAQAMQQAVGSVDELKLEVETGYKGALG
jgi:hypothetical protein